MLKVLLASAALLATFPALAAPPKTAVTGAHFVDPAGLAVHGWDAVSYFDRKPLKGDARYFTDRGVARYLFASAANKARFDADPARFEPQYGGYCAFGAAQGYKAPTIPETGVIIEGKLYFNYNKNVAARFNLDRAAYIAKADANWPRISNDPAPN